MAIDAAFRAGGIASGLDSNAIIDSLVKIEQAPFNLLKARQDALQMQVSALGDLTSKLTLFRDAATALKTQGVLALSATTSSTAFSATPVGGGAAGRYAVQVQAVASAAKARSSSFDSAFDPVMGGTLSLSIMGTTYEVAIADNSTLTEVAKSINAAGAPVSAVVLNDGTHSYLSLTNRDTGFPLTGAPGDALQITETSTGVQGHPLGLAITATATNARVQVDGLSFDRTSNVITDIVPGMQLTLKALSPGVEDLVTGYDTTATQANLDKFITAYNDVHKLVHKHLNIALNTDRAKTLGGDSVVRSLQSALSRLTTTSVGGSDVRTLADLGVKTAQDGSLSIDAAKLAAAVARNPGAVDSLFSTGTTGLSDTIISLSDRYTSSTEGLLVARQNGLTKNISTIGDTLLKMDARLATYKQNLIRQFTAMESVVSGLKSIGNFLNAQSAYSTGGNK